MTKTSEQSLKDRVEFHHFQGSCQSLANDLTKAWTLARDHLMSSAAERGSEVLWKASKVIACLNSWTHMMTSQLQAKTAEKQDEKKLESEVSRMENEGGAIVAPSSR
jgi:hypothetical protein